MARLNQKIPKLTTHEGATAKHISPKQQLERTVMSCMLWEKEAYEDGQDIANRIASLVSQLPFNISSEIAIKARTEGHLRHVPLLIAREMARHTKKGKLDNFWVSTTIAEVIQRPDELTEFLAIYWKDGKCPLSGQVKKGLAKAFQKFGAYSLAKYNRLDKAIKLRDVLFLCHAEPLNFEQDLDWKNLINNKLATPDTWEVEISASKNKLLSWTRLLSEGKLGGLALLRNLRNMINAGVDPKLIKSVLQSVDFSRVLPFRFVAAARYAPAIESDIEKAMLGILAQDTTKLKGNTTLLIDVSGSMNQQLSQKSDMTRIDAACGLAILAREICESVRIFTFSKKLCQIPDRRGFALRDAIMNSQDHLDTYLGKALQVIDYLKDTNRLIVFTDEQSRDEIPDLSFLPNKYLVNIASAKNGIGYYDWTHIDGFSEAVIKFIIANEAN